MDAAGRRQRRRDEVRERILDAAVELFLENGVDATTMDAIAQHADVARATVFNHFSTKTGVLQEWGARRRSRVAEVLAAEHAQERSTQWQLRAYLGALAELNQASRRETAVLIPASERYGGLLRSPALDVELGAILRDGQRRGEVRADVAVTESAELIAAGYFSSVLRWVATEPEPFDLAGRLDRMLDLLLPGLLA
jgi:AcrR family transcriptional regulator